MSKKTPYCSVHELHVAFEQSMSVFPPKHSGFFGERFMDKAKGLFMREQPLGLVSRVVANSLSEALKWPPRIPKGFIARGTKRLVEMF